MYTYSDQQNNVEFDINIEIVEQIFGNGFDVQYFAGIMDNYINKKYTLDIKGLASIGDAIAQLAAKSRELICLPGRLENGFFLSNVNMTRILCENSILIGDANSFSNCTHMCGTIFEAIIGTYFLKSIDYNFGLLISTGVCHNILFGDEYLIDKTTFYSKLYYTDLEIQASKIGRMISKIFYYLWGFQRIDKKILSTEFFPEEFEEFCNQLPLDRKEIGYRFVDSDLPQLTPIFDVFLECN